MFLQIASHEPLTFLDRYFAKVRQILQHDHALYKEDSIRAVKVFETEAKDSMDLINDDFVGFSIEDVYQFYKDHMQVIPSLDPWDNMEFSSFTFIAVDEACMNASPWQCIVGCDAPDFGECDTSEIKLKQIRVDLSDLGRVVEHVETLYRTPKEVVALQTADDKEAFRSLRQEPPAIYELTGGPDEDGKWDWIRAPVFVARDIRRMGIRAAEHEGAEVGKGKHMKMYGIYEDGKYETSFHDY